MEEMMMVMMKIRSQETSPNNNTLNIPNITTLTSPTWKLYENPFFTTTHHKPNLNININTNTNQLLQDCSTTDHKIIHRLHLPIPARKIAASFFDLTFVKPAAVLESDMDPTRGSRVNQLKAELECERKARKKMELLNKKLAREISEERKGREAIERVCEELAKEISAHKAEFFRMKKEMEEERKMLRTAEVIREERVQMKLAEAKFLLEEKFREMETNATNSSKREEEKFSSNNDRMIHQTSSFGQRLRFVLGEKLPVSNVDSTVAAVMGRRKGGAEAENPHIRRGIKGFVEFPKVVRAIGCRSSKHLGSKLECQKAQLKILLKQKGPMVRFNGIIAS
ncbi:hypothetical protein ABFX02_05G061800 [Erythranthe guttata]